MPRYYTLAVAPRADWDEQPAPTLPHPTIYVSEPVDTGILNSDGNAIYKGPDVIGFLR